MEKERKADRVTNLNPEMGTLSDISETGACLNVLDSPGSLTVLTLNLKSGNLELTINVRVMNIRQNRNSPGFKAGILFINPSLAEKEIIEEMVNDYSCGGPIKATVINL